MRIAAMERQEKHETIIQDFFPPLTEFPDERIYLGVNSWTLPDRKQRWLKKGAYFVTENGIQTAGEVARDYLDWKFPFRLRATKRQKDSLNIHRSAPLYVEPTLIEDAVYVDLKAAFWSIMLMVGWNVDYYPSNWIVRGTPPDDFPYADHKPARNSLVSCGLPSPLRMWTGKKVTRQWRTNVHINMGLWSLIMDTLHGIASYARELEACYIHTDGYILPRWNSPDLREKIEQYGLSSSIKADGMGVVLGMGNYKIGDKATMLYGNRGLMGGVDYTYRTEREVIASKLLKCKTNASAYATRHKNSPVRE